MRSYKREQIHGGDIYRNPGVTDFSVNSNPLGPPLQVVEAIRQQADRIAAYPDIQCEGLCEAIGRFEEVESEEVLCTNGAAELFFGIVQALKPKKALLPVPSFAEYEKALQAGGARIVYYHLQEKDGFCVTEDLLKEIRPDIEILFLCNPNNPTGQLMRKELLLRIAQACEEQGVWLVLDECFLDFLEDASCYDMKKEMKKFPHMLLVKAFTKLFCMPGLRLGYGLSSNEELLKAIRKTLQAWNVSVLAQAAGLAALKSPGGYLKQSRKMIKEERKKLQKTLLETGRQVFDTPANFLFLKGEKDLYQRALENGFLIRDCSNYPGLSAGYYRIAVRSPWENERMIKWLKKS